jgi:glycosyltransferase involved in cell wall biosynthesis
MLGDKGVGEYVEAARIIKKTYPDVEFQLLGSLDAVNKTAISKEQMQEWVEDGLVNYLGMTDNVQEYIKKVECVVLPSYREGTPRTLLESASMAKPLITTHVPGCKDVVNDGVNGFLCEVRNAEDLALQMEKMLQLSSDECIAMGKAGREKMINEFDESIVIEKYLLTILEYS